MAAAGAGGAKRPRVEGSVGRAGLRRVLVIHTGGTIGMKPSKRGYAPEKGFLTSVVETTSHINDCSDEATALIPEDLKATCAAAGCSVFVSPVTEFGERYLFSILEYDPLLDSSNMKIGEWRRIARDIEEQYERWHSFVVLHGTDTMAYAASILAFMLTNLSKTVVVTGSQIPLCQPRSDGFDNLLGALLCAAHFDIPEVALYFSNCLYRGCRSSKLHASDLRAFGSPNMEPLATVGIGFNVRWPLTRNPGIGSLQVDDVFCSDIIILRIFPGVFTAIRSLLAPLKGVIMQTFGAGNAPDQDANFLRALKEATDNGCVIVNITQCVRGEVAAHYATGAALLDVGVTPGFDMTPEAALAKLGWLLGSGRSPFEVRMLMMTNLRGELTVPDPEMKFSLHNFRFARVVARSLMALPEWRTADGSGDGDSTANNAVTFVHRALMPSLMCTAAACGNVPQLQALVADGATVNIADYDRRTPLHLACSEGRQDVAQFLLDNNADVHAKDRFGNTPLRAAVASGNRLLVRSLRARGATLAMTDNSLAGVLCTLARDNMVQELTLWCEAGANCDAGDYDERTALHLCAEVDAVAAARVLLGSGARPTLHDRFGESPLSIASKHGHTELRQILAMAGSADNR